MGKDLRHFVVGAVVVLALFIIPGCSGNGTDSGNTSTIDSKIDLSMSEHLDSIQHTLTFRAQTERIYGCSNYALSGSESVSGKTISVTFNNVTDPAVCATALGPAATNFDLGALAPGLYTFPIIVNGEISSSTLTITDSTYSILSGGGRWVGFTKTFLMKVPVGAVWGSASYNAPTAGTFYRTFTDSLNAFGAIPHQYSAGDYGYFQIDSSGTLILPSGTSNFHATFILQYNGDTQKVKAVLKQIGQSVGSQIVIAFYSYKGEAYISNVVAFQP